MEFAGLAIDSPSLFKVSSIYKEKAGQDANDLTFNAAHLQPSPDMA